MSTLGLQFPSIDAGISQFENVNPTYNNPGGLMYGNFTQQYGATGSSASGLAIFPNYSSGLNATDALVGSYANQGYSLADMINSWAPPSAGNANNQNYINMVSGTSGLDPNSPILGGFQGDLFPQQESTSNLSPLSGASNSWNEEPSGLSNIFNSLGNFGNSVPGPASIVNQLGQFAANPWAFLGSKAVGSLGITWGRIAAFLLGLVFIIGGLMQFKPVNEIVVDNVVKPARETATAAVAAA